MCEKFLALYALPNSKGVKVQEVWEGSRGVGGWNPRFVRSFNDLELELVEEFISTFHNRKVNSLERHKLVWKREKVVFFQLNPVLNLWKGGGQLLSLKGWCGNQCIPTKVSFFTWEAW